MANNLDYVKDVNNCAKQKELTLLLNVGSLLFDLESTLNIFTFECTHEQEFSSKNTFFKIREQHSRRNRENG